MKKLVHSRGYSLFCAIIFGLLAAIDFQDYRLIQKAMEMDIGVSQSDARVRLVLAALCALTAALHLYQWWKKGKDKKSQ